MAYPWSGCSSTDSRIRKCWLLFVKEGKLENLARNSQSRDENQQQTQPTYSIALQGYSLEVYLPGFPYNFLVPLSFTPVGRKVMLVTENNMTAERSSNHQANIPLLVALKLDSGKSHEATTSAINMESDLCLHFPPPHPQYNVDFVQASLATLYHRLRGEGGSEK